MATPTPEPMVEVSAPATEPPLPALVDDAIEVAAPPSQPSTAASAAARLDNLLPYLHFGGEKHWLLVKEGIHIILDRILIKDAAHLLARCPLYGRLSRAEKRSLVLKYASALIQRQFVVRNVLLDTLSICVYEACEAEARLESPPTPEKKGKARVPFMQKSLTEGGLGRAPAVIFNRDVASLFGTDYFLPPIPTFTGEDEKHLVESIRRDEEDAGKETVFAANLKKALKLIRQGGGRLKPSSSSSSSHSHAGKGSSFDAHAHHAHTSHHGGGVSGGGASGGGELDWSADATADTPSARVDSFVAGLSSASAYGSCSNFGGGCDGTHGASATAASTPGSLTGTTSSAAATTTPSATAGPNGSGSVTAAVLSVASSVTDALHPRFSAADLHAITDTSSTSTCADDDDEAAPSLSAPIYMLPSVHTPAAASIVRYTGLPPLRTAPPVSASGGGAPSTTSTSAPSNTPSTNTTASNGGGGGGGGGGGKKGRGACPGGIDWWCDLRWVHKFCRPGPAPIVKEFFVHGRAWVELWASTKDPALIERTFSLNAEETCEVIDHQPLWLSLRGMVGSNLYADGMWPITSNDGHLTLVRFKRDDRGRFWYIDRSALDFVQLAGVFLGWARTFRVSLRQDLRSLGRAMAENNVEEVSRSIQRHLESAILSFMVMKAVTVAIELEAARAADRLGSQLVLEEELALTRAKHKSKRKGEAAAAKKGLVGAGNSSSSSGGGGAGMTAGVDASLITTTTTTAAASVSSSSGSGTGPAPVPAASSGGKRGTPSKAASQRVGAVATGAASSAAVATAAAVSAASAVVPGSGLSDELAYTYGEEATSGSEGEEGVWEEVTHSRVKPAATTPHANHNNSGGSGGVRAPASSATPRKAAPGGVSTVATTAPLRSAAGAACAVPASPLTRGLWVSTPVSAPASGSTGSGAGAGNGGKLAVGGGVVSRGVAQVALAPAHSPMKAPMRGLPPAGAAPLPSTSGAADTATSAAASAGTGAPPLSVKTLVTRMGSVTISPMKATCEATTHTQGVVGMAGLITPPRTQGKGGRVDATATPSSLSCVDDLPAAFGVINGVLVNALEASPPRASGLQGNSNSSSGTGGGASHFGTDHLLSGEPAWQPALAPSAHLPSSTNSLMSMSMSMSGSNSLMGMSVGGSSSLWGGVPSDSPQAAAIWGGGMGFLPGYALPPVSNLTSATATHMTSTSGIVGNQGNGIVTAGVGDVSGSGVSSNGQDSGGPGLLSATAPAFVASGYGRSTSALSSTVTSATAAATASAGGLTGRSTTSYLEASTGHSHTFPPFASGFDMHGLLRQHSAPLPLSAGSSVGAFMPHFLPMPFASDSGAVQRALSFPADMSALPHTPFSSPFATGSGSGVGTTTSSGAGLRYTSGKAGPVPLPPGLPPAAVTAASNSGAWQHQAGYPHPVNGALPPPLPMQASQPLYGTYAAAPGAWGRPY